MPLVLRQVSVHVITNNVLSPVTRLVESLKTSHFLGDEVSLSFHADLDADGELMDYLVVRDRGEKSL